MPADAPDWRGGFAALPFASPLPNRRRRVYFSGRDRWNRSHIGACTLDLERLAIEAESVSRRPLLSPGPAGRFDDCGCSMSCIVEGDGWLRLYYTGWTLRATVPFSLAIGVATSDDGGSTFQRLFDGPLIGCDRSDPYLCASPSILVEDGRWRMWYVSGDGWERRGEQWHPRYRICYAESADGLDWRREGRVCIPFGAPDEHAMGRPHVLRDRGGYRMWFCVRGERYRLAYAESDDGLTWRRRDREAEVPPSDWDREMQAYPMVWRDGDELWMLYNGNGYGATGFGCATRSGNETA
jgi:hypothetical protein